MSEETKKTEDKNTEEQSDQGKNPEGRPTDYKGLDTLLKANKYIDSCKDEEYQRVKSDGDKSTTYDNLVKVKIPTIEGLAAHLEVSRSTVYEWKAKYAEFSDIIERLQQLQAERLINNGLSGTYNPTIAKVLLTKHGYIERQAVGLDGGEDEDGKRLPINVNKMSDEEIDEYLKKRMNERANNDKGK